MHTITEHVTNAQTGDLSAFQTVVALRQRRVAAIALAITGDAAAADDITQNVFTKVWRSLGRLQQPEAFDAWLRTTTVRESRQWLRASSRRARWHREAGTVDQLARVANTPLDSLSAKERSQLLQAGLAALSDDDRMVLTLYYQDGEDAPKVAEALQLQPATVRKRLQRARERLRSEVLVVLIALLTAASPSPARAATVASTAVRSARRSRQLAMGLTTAATALMWWTTTVSAPVVAGESPSSQTVVQQTAAVRASTTPMTVEEARPSTQVLRIAMAVEDRLRMKSRRAGATPRRATTHWLSVADEHPFIRSVFEEMGATPMEVLGPPEHPGPMGQLWLDQPDLFEMPSDPADDPWRSVFVLTLLDAKRTYLETEAAHAVKGKRPDGVGRGFDFVPPSTEYINHDEGRTETVIDATRSLAEAEVDPDLVTEKLRAAIAELEATFPDRAPVTDQDDESRVTPLRRRDDTSVASAALRVLDALKPGEAREAALEVLLSEVVDDRAPTSLDPMAHARAALASDHPHLRDIGAYLLATLGMQGATLDEEVIQQLLTHRLAIGQGQIQSFVAIAVVEQLYRVGQHTEAAALVAQVRAELAPSCPSITGWCTVVERSLDYVDSQLIEDVPTTWQRALIAEIQRCATPGLVEKEFTGHGRWHEGAWHWSGWAEMLPFGIQGDAVDNPVTRCIETTVTGELAPPDGQRVDLEVW